LGGTALLQGQELFGTERFIVDLGGGFDQILEVRAGEEVSQMDEFAVVFVFNVDDTEFVCTGADYLTFDVEGLFGANDGEWNSVLQGR
jgi:hypothetical protein